MELHVYVNAVKTPRNATKTYYETMEQFKKRKTYIYTTQTHFIDKTVLDAGYRLFVHQGLDMREVRYGECNKTKESINSRMRDVFMG